MKTWDVQCNECEYERKSLSEKRAVQLAKKHRHESCSIIPSLSKKEGK